MFSNETSIVVPVTSTCGMTMFTSYHDNNKLIDDNILEETNQVLNQFKQDGSCDHTSELSPVMLVQLHIAVGGWG